MYLTVKTYLRTAANHTLWLNQAPTAFTTLEGQFKTADLRPRFRAVDEFLDGMDDLVVQFAVNANGTPNEAGALFVVGYFNARRIGGTSSGGEEEEGGGEGGGTTPPPENPPAPNP